jgi:uncharacterized glyoxalase superfamily protein PhnB
MAGKVSPIPAGQHTVTPHLVIREATKAIDFYKKAFGVKDKDVMLMKSPDGKKIMHAELKIGDSWVYVADEFPEMGSKSPQALGGSPVTIHLYVDDVDKTFKQAVAAGATVKMPVTDMFWGDRFGKLSDPFGNDWSVATHIKDVTPEECEKAGAEAMAKFKKK